MKNRSLLSACDRLSGTVSGNPDNLFTIEALVPGEQAAGSVESTGCKLVYPS